MIVLRAGIREAGTAVRAQSPAVLAAQRRQREREHDRVAKSRLEVEQISVEKAPVSVLVVVAGQTAARFLVELAEGYLDGRGDRLQAPGAFARYRRHRFRGHQHPLRDGFQHDVQPHLGAGRHAGQRDMQISRGRYEASLASRCSRLAAQWPGVEHQWAARIGVFYWITYQI